jgi:two-component system NtrC family sensor kinase
MTQDIATMFNQVLTRFDTLERETGMLRALADRLAQSEAVWLTVGKVIISDLDLDSVLTTVTQVINENLNVETGSILLLEPHTQELTFAEILSGDQKQFAAMRLRAGQGIAGWIAQNKQSVIVPDVMRDPRFFSAIDSQTGFHTRSIMGVPLIVADEVIGVIELLNKRDGDFTNEDLSLLESIAAPVAIAIQNARLRQQLDRQFSEQTELLQKIERAKREWESTIDAIEEGILVVDEQCQVLRVNRALASWLGATPAALVGNFCYRVVHGLDAPPAHCPHAHVVSGQGHARNVEYEEPHLRRTLRFTAYPIHAHDGALIGTANVLKDVTLERRLQAQLIQSEKLAATGRMAASLAHEINNPLQAIQGCLDLAQANLNKPEKQTRYLTMATGEISRLATFVQRMLDFSRPAKGNRALIAPRALIDDVLALTGKRLSQARVRVQINWDERLPRVNGAGNQLKQVFLNLVLNAIEAMPQGGTLTLAGRVVEEDGRWVALSFADSGVGIAPDDLKNIFEPFYTTKPDGTGLGLAVSHNIILGHHGHFTVESAVGKGTTVTVWLGAEE